MGVKGSIPGRRPSMNFEMPDKNKIYAKKMCEIMMDNKSHKGPVISASKNNFTSEISSALSVTKITNQKSNFTNSTPSRDYFRSDSEAPSYQTNNMNSTQTIRGSSKSTYLNLRFNPNALSKLSKNSASGLSKFQKKPKAPGIQIFLQPSLKSDSQSGTIVMDFGPELKDQNTAGGEDGSLSVSKKKLYFSGTKQDGELGSIHLNTSGTDGDIRDMRVGRARTKNCIFSPYRSIGGTTPNCKRGAPIRFIVSNNTTGFEFYGKAK
jgi:hypothetical protein